MEQAVGYIQKRYGIKLELPPIQCDFSSRNAQFLGKRCPYNVSDKL